MNAIPANDWHEAPDEAFYDRVEAEVARLHGNGDFSAAFELLDTTWPGLPGEAIHPSMQVHLLTKTHLLARLGRAEEVLDVARAFHRLGYSLPLQWKIYNVLRPLGGYGEVAQENARLAELAQRDAKLECDVRLPAAYDAAKAYPLALVLHGDGGSIATVQEFWKADPMLERGYIVAYVQSSQLSFTAHYAWLLDPAVAWKDVRTCYEEVCAKRRIDTSSLILCGFSGGPITAVDLTFGEALPITGFIGLCPEIKPEHFTSEAVARAVERGVRGVFIEGGLVWPLDDEREMFDAMQEAGLPIELILNEGLGHAAPPDFNTKLRRALDFALT